MNYGQLAARLERYPGSPLFARLASEHLDSGRVSEARTLCEAGLLEYPDYSTAHLILAECHAAENRYRDAVDALEKALALNPDSLMFAGLLDEWEELLVGIPEVEELEARSEEDRPESTEIFPSTTIPSEAIDALPETAVAPAETVPDSPEAGPAPSEPIPVETEAIISPAADWVQVALESATVPPGTMTPAPVSEENPEDSVQAAPEAQTSLPGNVALPAETETVPSEEAAMPLPPLQSITAPSISAQDQHREDRLVTEAVTLSQESAGEFSDEGRIVSKTLAEIYATQGAFDEAILTYRLLRRTRPELVPQIDRRIVELETLAHAR
jgi:tetratricopeptide (TPR) repeat protein